jgi:drug/metabolite transporter (DMT)-like permease
MKIVIGFTAMILCTVAANLMLKLGATRTESQTVILGWLTVRSILGFGFFAVAGLIYSWLLKWLPLNVATSFAAAQFVAVILASALILLEPISLGRTIGILLIVTGIVVVAWSH